MTIHFVKAVKPKYRAVLWVWNGSRLVEQSVRRTFSCRNRARRVGRRLCREQGLPVSHCWVEQVEGGAK